MTTFRDVTQRIAGGKSGIRGIADGVLLVIRYLAHPDYVIIADGNISVPGSDVG